MATTSREQRLGLGDPSSALMSPSGLLHEGRAGLGMFSGLPTPQWMSGPGVTVSYAHASPRNISSQVHTRKSTKSESLSPPEGLSPNSGKQS